MSPTNLMFSHASVRRLLGLICLSAVIVAVELPQACAQSDFGPVIRRRIHTLLGEMFEHGIGPRRSGSKALVAFKQADQLSHSDPRVTCAWALIQHKRLQREQALELLDKAAKQSDEIYFPARRAKVWFQVVSSRQFKSGVAEAEKLANEVAKATKQPKAREVTAQWLSETLASAVRTAKRSADVAAAKAAESKVKKILIDAGLGRAWSVGQTAIASFNRLPRCR